MQFFVLALLISALVTLLVIRSGRLHSALTGDNDLQGPQKFHSRPVPRVGGVGIFLAMAGVVALAAFQGRPTAASLLALLACSLPAFVAGFLEDLTKRVSVLQRLLATMLAAACAAWQLGALIHRTDLFWLDAALAAAPAAWLLTVIAVAGLANAINIIDGFNGLASMVSAMMFASMAYVALQIGDPLIVGIAAMMMGCIAGFFIWNFPAGLIFLGDGGAYLLGFMLAECSILLVLRNPQVSAWFPLLLFIYPIFETLFSIYRRTVIRGKAPGTPDGVHLHSLIYRRLMRWVLGGEHAARITLRNSMTSPYLWLLCAMAVFPATLFWHTTGVLMVFVALFCAMYLWLYGRIVRFRTPAWLRWGMAAKKSDNSH